MSRPSLRIIHSEYDANRELAQPPRPRLWTAQKYNDAFRQGFRKGWNEAVMIGACFGVCVGVVCGYCLVGWFQ